MITKTSCEKCGNAAITVEVTLEYVQISCFLCGWKKLYFPKPMTLIEPTKEWTCGCCGRKFRSVHYRKYAPDCEEIIRKEKQAEYMKKFRNKPKG